ncbi:hypothetical protein N9R79_08025 [Vibrio sp.]|nr:hypothetical protein [Vibrio sp.]
MSIKYCVMPLVFLGAITTSVQAEVKQEAWAVAQHGWSHCKYELVDSDTKIACFQELINQGQDHVKSDPDNMKLRLWYGINLASLAGEDGGLGALDYVKEAKKQFEIVIETDPNTQFGSAYTSLGSLYYQVPGWPIAFGDDDKAKEMLEKGLEINPNGMDSNFWYASYLAEDGQDKKALQYLEKAKKAPARPDRQLADRGRHQEIDHLMKELKK